MKITHRYIFLTRGGGQLYAIVDHEDFDRLAAYGWHAHIRPGRQPYACTLVGPKRRRVYMHRLVKRGRVIDHADGNGLHNRRRNLRATDARRNAINHPVRVTSSTGFKGVTPVGGKFRAAITDALGRRRHLGLFVTDRLAAEAYDRAALEEHGPFARLNFPSLARAS